MKTSEESKAENARAARRAKLLVWGVMAVFILSLAGGLAWQWLGD